MGFSKKIKRKALVASARRCCVCKKFKGRNIEVHHLIPRSEGGEDTYENAIPLCYECHAEAGHYNPDHPKGTKYSPDELRKHRVQWYETVENGQFKIDDLSITQQYFVCNSFDIVWELIDGNFENFPLSPVKIVQNDLFNYLQKVASFQNKEDRNLRVKGDSFNNLEEYLNLYPNVIEKESRWGTKQYFRTPSINELKQKFFDNDFVVNYMIRHNAKPSEIAYVDYTEHGCVDVNYESYNLRPAKVVFFSLLNSSEETLHLESITEYTRTENDFLKLDNIKGEKNKSDFEGIPLEGGSCLLIPICIALFPFKINSDFSGHLIRATLENRQVQEVRELDENIEDYSTIGPINKVKNVEIQTPKSTQIIDIRKVDLSKLLLISRFWEYGSCPHIIMRYSFNKKWKAIQELFPSFPGKKYNISINLNQNPYNSADLIQIVEIEDELTFLEQVIVDGNVYGNNILLEKGDSFTIEVQNNQQLKIEGYYMLFDNIRYKNNDYLKQHKINFVCADLNSSIINS